MIASTFSPRDWSYASGTHRPRARSVPARRTSGRAAASRSTSFGFSASFALSWSSRSSICCSRAIAASASFQFHLLSVAYSVAASAGTNSAIAMAEMRRSLRESPASGDFVRSSGSTIHSRAAASMAAQTMMKPVTRHPGRDRRDRYPAGSTCARSRTQRSLPPPSSNRIGAPHSSQVRAASGGL